eukprot:15216-Pelagomonas_calceolata.AAC.1
MFNRGKFRKGRNAQGQGQEKKREIKNKYFQFGTEKGLLTLGAGWSPDSTTWEGYYHTIPLGASSILVDEAKIPGVIKAWHSYMPLAHAKVIVPTQWRQNTSSGGNLTSKWALYISKGPAGVFTLAARVTRLP